MCQCAASVKPHEQSTCHGSAPIENEAKSLVAHSHVIMTMWPERNSTRICQAEPTLDQPCLYVRRFIFRHFSFGCHAQHGFSSGAAAEWEARHRVPLQTSRRSSPPQRGFPPEVPPTSSATSSHKRGHLMTSLRSQQRTMTGTGRSLSFFWHVENNYVTTLKVIQFHLIFKKNVCSNDGVLVLFFSASAGKLTKCIESVFVYLLCWRMALVWYFDGTTRAVWGYNKVVFCIHRVEFIPIHTFLPISDFRSAWTTLLMSRYKPHLNKCKKETFSRWLKVFVTSRCMGRKLTNIPQQSYLSVLPNTLTRNCI